MNSRNKYKCCICGKELDGWGNNPWPVVKDKKAECCDDCNWDIVIPARIKVLYGNKEEIK